MVLWQPDLPQPWAQGCPPFQQWSDAETDRNRHRPPQYRLESSSQLQGLQGLPPHFEEIFMNADGRSVEHGLPLTA